VLPTTVSGDAASGADSTESVVLRHATRASVPSASAVLIVIVIHVVDVGLNILHDFIMPPSSWRPLPTPPTPAPASSTYPDDRLDDIHILTNPFHTVTPYPPPFVPSVPTHLVHNDQPTSLRGGTLLHTGFYDLLAMIPTPSPSRLLWGRNARIEPIAGPRYEDIPAVNNVPERAIAAPSNSSVVGPLSPKKGRRISKDMVSKPMGFVYVWYRHTGNSRLLFL